MPLWHDVFVHTIFEGAAILMGPICFSLSNAGVIPEYLRPLGIALTGLGFLGCYCANYRMEELAREERMREFERLRPWFELHEQARRERMQGESKETVGKRNRNVKNTAENDSSQKQSCHTSQNSKPEVQPATSSQGTLQCLTSKREEPEMQRFLAQFKNEMKLASKSLDTKILKKYQQPITEDSKVEQQCGKSAVSIPHHTSGQETDDRALENQNSQDETAGKNRDCVEEIPQTKRIQRNLAKFKEEMQLVSKSLDKLIENKISQLSNAKGQIAADSKKYRKRSNSHDKSSTSAAKRLCDRRGKTLKHLKLFSKNSTQKASPKKYCEAFECSNTTSGFKTGLKSLNQTLSTNLNHTSESTTASTIKLGSSNSQFCFGGVSTLSAESASHSENTKASSSPNVFPKLEPSQFVTPAHLRTQPSCDKVSLPNTKRLSNGDTVTGCPSSYNSCFQSSSSVNSKSAISVSGPIDKAQDDGSEYITSEEFVHTTLVSEISISTDPQKSSPRISSVSKAEGSDQPVSTHMEVVSFPNKQTSPSLETSVTRISPEKEQKSNLKQTEMNPSQTHFEISGNSKIGEDPETAGISSVSDVKISIATDPTKSHIETSDYLELFESGSYDFEGTAAAETEHKASETSNSATVIDPEPNA